MNRKYKVNYGNKVRDARKAIVFHAKKNQGRKATAMGRAMVEAAFASVSKSKGRGYENKR